MDSFHISNCRMIIISIEVSSYKDGVKPFTVS